MLQPSHNINTH